MTQVRGRRALGGFTLVELLVVMVVLAVGAVIAAPQLSQTLRIQRARAATTDLTSSLLLARSEAIKRRDQVRIAPQTPGDWTTGWRVAAATSGNQLDRKDPLGEGIEVARAPATIVYERTGRLSTPGLVRVQVSDVGHGGPRCITIDPSGLPRSSLGSCP